MTPAQLNDLKDKSQCHKCGKYGHWHSDHNQDGSLKLGARSSPAPIQNDSGSTSSKKTVTFGMVKMVSDDHDIDTDFFGPLLDDGAPYSGMGLFEF